MKRLEKLFKIIIVMILMLGGLLTSSSMSAFATTKVEYTNVFDKNNTDNWLKALSYDGKMLSNASNYANMFTTHKIEVQKRDTLTWGLFGKDQYVMELYNENDGFVRRVFSTELEIEEEETTVIGVGNSSYTEVKASYKIQDEDCAYARILGNISTMDNFMVFVNLENGLPNWPTKYVPFQNNEDPDNPLRNKSALFVGDSIVNAVKDPQKPYYGWAGRIGTSNDMQWKNAGISSATVSLALPNSYKENRIVNQLKDNANKAYDYVILQGGMNDSIIEREIGNISDSYRLEDFDISTFSGAMEEMLYTAVHEYDEARIGYIATYATPNSTWGGKSADNVEYFRRAKELCEKWNVPYIDLFEGGIEVDGVYQSYSFDILKMNSGVNLYGGDRTEIHIGSKGYDVISPFIADWMRTLQPYEEKITPVLKVTFDDETANDSSGRNNHGVTVGEAQFVDGVKGKAIRLQNRNHSSSSIAQQYVNFGTVEDLQFGTEDYSILFNYKSVGGSTSDSSIIGNKSWASGGNEGFAIINYSNRFGLNFTAAGSSRADTEGIRTTEDRSWHQIAAVFDRDGDMKLFVDGKETSSKDIRAFAGKSINKSDFIVGADGLKQYAMEDVFIDELEVYRHAFTEKELIALNAVEPTAPDTDYDISGTDFSKNDKNLEMLYDLDETPMTYETWVKFDENQLGNSSVIMGNYSDYTHENIPILNMEVNAYGEPRLYGYVKNVATDYRATGFNLYNNVWTHLAITTEEDPEIEGNMIFTTYINGKNMHSQSLAYAPIQQDQQLRIGEDTRESMYMHGSLADMRVWTTTRTEEEIKEGMMNEVSSDASGLLGNWLLDTEENGVYKDRSIHGNDAVAFWIDGEELFNKSKDGYKTIAVIPDTQSLTLFRPNSYKKLTKWIADQKDTLGIEFAIHVGDIVNDREVPSQWKTAVDSMKTLEDANIPYVFSPGNHDTEIQKVDGVWFGVRDTTKMNQNFPYSKYSKQPSFGGAYKEGEMDNAYSYFTVNNVEFMTISLEQNPRDEVLEWANKVAEENPEKRILVTTHEYLYADGERTTKDTFETLSYIGGSNQGEMLWEKFAKKHKNIVAVIGGHVAYPDVLATEDIGDHGNKVQQILCDAQLLDKFEINTNGNEGLGMVMLMSFKEGSNDVDINWYSTVKEKLFRQSNQITLSMKLNENEDTSFLLTIIKNAMNKAEAIMKSDDFEKLAPAVQAIIEKRYNEAKIVYEAKDANVEKCSEAWLNLANALQYADFKADKVLLTKLIDEIKEMDLHGYTVESVANLNAALAEAETIVNDENVLQDSINQAYNNLDKALAALVANSNVNKTVLADLIQKTQYAIDNEALYQQNDAWTAFKTAFENANVVFENKEATQEEINHAAVALADAFTTIRLLPSEELLTQLETFVNIVTSIDRTCYSAANLALIDETYVKANLMLENKNFGEQEFSAFEPKMVEVLNIIANDKGIPVVNDNEDTKNVETSTRTTNNHGVVATGDNTNIALFSLMALMSTTSCYAIYRKRKNKDDKYM